jgi:hypothetical protein
VPFVARASLSSAALAWEDRCQISDDEDSDRFIYWRHWRWS